MLEASLVRPIVLKERLELEFIERLGLIRGGLDEKGKLISGCDVWKKWEARMHIPFISIQSPRATVQAAAPLPPDAADAARDAGVRFALRPLCAAHRALASVLAHAPPPMHSRLRGDGGGGSPLRCA